MTPHYKGGTRKASEGVPLGSGNRAETEVGTPLWPCQERTGREGTGVGGEEHIVGQTDRKTQTDTHTQRKEEEGGETEAEREGGK